MITEIRPTANSYELGSVGKVRVCSSCGLLLKAELFSVRRDSGKLRSDCKECVRAYRKREYDKDPQKFVERARAYRRRNPERAREADRRHHFKTTYGISLEDFDSMLAAQGGVCAICGTDSPRGPGRRFCVDHDHKTGEVRGILCMPCNTALGGFGDDPSKLQSAINYLEGVSKCLPTKEAE